MAMHHISTGFVFLPFESSKCAFHLLTCIWTKRLKLTRKEDKL